MIMNLKDLVKKYNLNINGVLHIGSHYGEEYGEYKDLNINKMIFFEPLYGNFTVLKGNVGSEVILINKALGNDVGKKIMYVETANQGQSSSLLEPKKHLEQYPNITFPYREEVDMEKLDNIDIVTPEYNMINCDVQGFELEVFKGAEKTLHKIDYIYCEVNRDELYKNCPMVEELDEFLSKFGFERVETSWVGGSWGDALYVKKKPLTLLTTFKKSDDDARNDEYLYSLQKNYENSNIDKIIIFYENDSDKDFQIVDEPKIQLVKIDFRPSFKTFIDYANENLKNNIIIIANGDVHFQERGLEKLRLVDYKDNLFFAITRYDKDNYHYYRLCGDGLYGSHDAWAFQSPIKDFKNDVLLGVPGCDNWILQRAQEAGFETYNISSSIILYHNHSEKTGTSRNYLDPSLWYYNMPEYRREDYTLICNIDKVLQKHPIFKKERYYDIDIIDTLTSAQLFKVNEKLLPFVGENDTTQEWFYVSSNFPLQYNLYLDFQKQFNKNNVSMLDINPVTGYNSLVFAYGFKNATERNYVFIDNDIERENGSTLTRESLNIYKENIDDNLKYFIIKANYFENEAIEYYGQFKYDIIQFNKYTNIDNLENDIKNMLLLLNKGGYILLNNCDLYKEQIDQKLKTIEHLFINKYYINSYNGMIILQG